MSTPSRDELQLEAVVQQTSDRTQSDDAKLVEMGKVSDTRGAFFGSKIDVGSGFQYV